MAYGKKLRWADLDIPGSRGKENPSVATRVKVSKSMPSSSPMRILAAPSSRNFHTPARVPVKSPSTNSKIDFSATNCRGNSAAQTYKSHRLQRCTPGTPIAPSRVLRVAESVPSPSPRRILATPAKNPKQTPARVPAQASSLRRKVSF
ncbi:hypothetical protein EGW08_022958 [Elysia chlorotica]|uniref:Uncharacterized protein n=1 Tax=Elysia chlorotica TaxID=188477 RepID=A0A433SJK2_ELYCH|nr:hypothetical protein EGW08_022958 [Elysia chlorotica]